MSKLILKDNKLINVRNFGKDLFMNYINTNTIKLVLAARTADNGVDPELESYERIEEMFRIYSAGIVQEFELYDEGDFAKIPINWMDMDGTITFTNTGEGTCNLGIDLSFSNDGDE